MTIADECKESRGATIGKRALAIALLAGLAGCVTVEAPEKPIVINLNINIKQEVVYRLDGDAKALIDEQGDIF
ncbi:MAG: YnbE family lipoprotein [Sphingomonadales bacterium]|nr:YnbE family lipoprotein [Sphingomonadales bacterium]